MIQKSKSKPLEQLIGTVGRILHRSSNDNGNGSNGDSSDSTSDLGPSFFIAALEIPGSERNHTQRISVKGTVHPSDFKQGLTYVFHGRFDDRPNKYPGRTFNFEVVVPHEPNSRRGTMLYLADLCPGVGTNVACQLFDIFGSDACSVLRNDPELAHSKVPRLSLENARQSSKILKANAELQDTKIELRELFAGTGIPRSTIELSVKKWGPLAPRRIRRDPFTLLVAKLPGCGFLRCNRLYEDFGLPPNRLKRQMICLWHSIRESREGHTWFAAGGLDDVLKASIGGIGVKVNIFRAVKLGKRSGWLATKKDENGKWWVADGDKAKNEKELAKKIAELMLWQGEAEEVLPRFTEALGGECEVAGTGDWMVMGHDEEMTEYEERPEDKPSIPSLLEIGRSTGICQRCGRRLVHPNSLAAGVGPYCAQQWGVLWGAVAESAETLEIGQST